MIGLILAAITIGLPFVPANPEDDTPSWQIHAILCVTGLLAAGALLIATVLVWTVTVDAAAGVTVPDSLSVDEFEQPVVGQLEQLGGLDVRRSGMLPQRCDGGAARAVAAGGARRRPRIGR